MPLAIDPMGTKEYVLKREQKKPADNQTRFKLKNLTARERAFIDDNMSQFTADGRVLLNSNLTAIRALECGLVGWENFKDAKGNQIQFIKEPPKDWDAKKVFTMPWDYLSREDRQELADAIKEMGQLTENEIKNS